MMKKGLLIALLVVFGAATSNAQTKAKAKTAAKATPTKVVTPALDGPGMLFENETIDYGTIPHNSDGKREFVFTNNGNKPLIIESAQGSCGCTVPTKPDGPIAPGAKASISVKYATDRVGAFTKTVTVKSNASDQPKLLTIKGTVQADPTPATGAEPVKS